MTIEDLSALAARLAASVGDVRGCLIVSRDGLVMGAHPEDGVAQLRPAWLRFAALGEPDRSFVQFGDEIWCYVRRGAYAAFLVTSVAVRPGLAIDRIEQALLTAEEGRSKRQSLKAPEASGAPSGKPRTPLHADSGRVDEPVLIHSEVATSELVPPVPHFRQVPAQGPDAPTAPPASRDPLEAAARARRSEDAGEDEVDRVLLAREFSQLLQEDENGADA